MALRFCSRPTKLLVVQPKLQVVRWLNVPKELPRRTPYVPLTGFALLSIPAYFIGKSFYTEICWHTLESQLIEEVSASLAPVVDLPVDLNELVKMNYRHVRIKGHFEHEKEVLIKNKDRYLGIEGLAGSWIQWALTMRTTRDDSRFFKRDPGHHVVTPFVLSDGKTRILVNRGWIPPDKADPATRPGSLVKGQVELTGYVRTRDEADVDPLPYLFHNPEKGEFRYRDIMGMARYLNTLPIYVEVDRESAPHYGTAPLGGQTNTEWYEHPSFPMYSHLIAGLLAFALWYAKYIGPIRFRRYN